MQPQYPTQPQPQYAPQYPVQPGYPPQQWPAAYPQIQQPQPPVVQGSLDEFFDQPGGGSGASWKFKDKPLGTMYYGIVARPIGKADVRQQTGPTGPVFFKDGRPKFVMIVPMIVQPTQEYPEGTAAWWVKGQSRDELVRAMAEAGAPVGPPEAGAAISVTLVGKRPIPNMSDAYQYRVQYARPAGTPGSQPAVTQVQPAYVPVGGPVEQYNNPSTGDQQYAPAPQAYGPQPTQPGYVPNQVPIVPPATPYAPAPQAQPAYVQGMEGHPIPALNIGTTVTPPVQPPAQPAPAVAATGLNADQQALLALLSGQKQA